jgi:hypothetical protein
MTTDSRHVLSFLVSLPAMNGSNGWGGGGEEGTNPADGRRTHLHGTVTKRRRRRQKEKEMKEGGWANVFVSLLCQWLFPRHTSASLPLLQVSRVSS